MSDDRNPETNGMRIPRPPAGTVYTPGRSQRTDEKVWTEQVQLYVTDHASDPRLKSQFIGKDGDMAVFEMSF